MSFQASCPSCGATVVFRFESTLVSVCSYCHVAIARQGADLATYGQVAEPIATPTLFKVGIGGRLADGRAFTLAGRVQLSYGAGRWDEWHVGFDDGTWAWLAEAQGKLHLMMPADLASPPRFADVRPEKRFPIGAAGTFVVEEVREAKLMAGEGELPFKVEPGASYHYADLAGPRHQLATLDYGAGDDTPALYLGREMALAELGLATSDLASEEDVRGRTTGKALSCTQCGGPLELRAPDQTLRVACPYCGAILDATERFAVLQTLDQKKVPKPRIPLGSTGKLDGIAWTVIAFLERSTRVEGVRYSWQEYLLHEPAAGFSWLVESQGHWSHVASLSPAEVEKLGHGSNTRTVGGLRFKHFQSSLAVVDHVIGEVYWAVSRGEKVTADDYICPPYILSREKSEDEVNWSRGRYCEPSEIWEAFQLEDKPPYRRGVGANQPYPGTGSANLVVITGLLGAMFLFGIFVTRAVTGGSRVHEEHATLQPYTKSGSEEAVLFTDTFHVPTRGNVQVRVDAPVDNSWLYLDGALINQDSGELSEFDVEVSYYHGSDWTEGSTHAAAYVPAVSPGTYVLRLAPQWEEGRPHADTYDVTVRSAVPRFHHLVLALMAIGIFPVLAGLRHLRFEQRRWSESDYPWGGS
ncbi:MAG: DUF4178 domain-containing protein [Acidobacteriota bacterium]